MNSQTPGRAGGSTGNNAKLSDALSRQDTLLDPSRVMVVEDDLALQEAIIDTLELAGCEVLAAVSAEQALELLTGNNVDMVISDVNMGGMDGHQLLTEIKKNKPWLPVLLITAYGTIQRSVSALKNGAVDYLVKPFEPGALIALVKQYALGGFAGEDQPIACADTSKSLYQLAERVALTDSTVLIEGESGTGKEVLARFIHANSARSEQPFVAINCAAIPETMLEATLFGYERGAFTGAHQSAPGKFEQANGGTLLLDEISEMDLSLQAKLLRVIQEREVERLGGRKMIELDLRIIATTNRDLKTHTAEGKFREDLFYRLSVFPLHTLPLQQRIEDIVPLARHFLMYHAQKMQRAHTEFSVEAEQALQQYSWPGNVRELENVIQRALILQQGVQVANGDLMFDKASDSSLLSMGDSPAQVISLSRNRNAKAVTGDVESNGGALEDDLKQREYSVILDTLKITNGSRKAAAEKLGVSPRTLRYKLAQMRELGLIS